MAIKVALMGAGGKMGMRITNNIKDHPDYNMAYVEVSDAGVEQLKSVHGVGVTPQGEALTDADAVVLALPDRLIGKISAAIVPELKSGAMLVSLDPAAAYAGVIPIREDLSYFVTHPCHPPLFGDDAPASDSTDWFGGVTAAQHIVNALHHGSEEDYATGEALAKVMYGPILGSHRVTVEQMAILEPALVETFSATLITAIKEGYDRVVEMGIPEEAAWQFLLGHVRIELAIILGFAGFPFSDGAKLAVQNAKSRIFRDEWKSNVFGIENVQHSVREITDSLEK